MAKESAPSLPRRASLFDVWRGIAQAGDAVAWRWLALALSLVTAGGLLGVAPLALKAIVDRLSHAGSSSASAGVVAGYGAAYVIALLLQRLFEQGQAYAYGVGEQRFVRQLSGRSLAHMLRLPIAFHLDNKSGALAQALSDGVLGWRLICTHAVLTIAPVLVQTGVAAAVLTSVFGAQAAGILFAALAAYTAVFTWGVVRLHGSVRAVSAAQVEVGGSTADTLMNVETIKAFTAERRFARRHDQALGETERRWRTYLARRLENGLAVGVIFAGMMGATVLIAGERVLSGALTVGAFVLVTTYILQLVRPLELMGFALRDVGQGYAYLEKLLTILARAAEPDEEARETISHGPAHLVFEDVSFAFTPERPILRRVSVEAPPGALIGVVGPSGAGKSSLLRLILRFYEPVSGRILLDGQPISELPLAVLRRQIALVSQDTILFNDTIAQNIAVAEEAPDVEAITEAAGKACLSDLIRSLPDGLATQVGERGLKLSGGEKQRVSIARAALKRARLVILDEATAALDPATERAVWDALAGLAQSATTLVVTHRLSTVARADQILVLDQGEIAERGRHRELLAAKGLYWRLWRAQGGGGWDDGAEDYALASSF